MRVHRLSLRAFNHCFNLFSFYFLYFLTTTIHHRTMYNFCSCANIRIFVNHHFNFKNKHYTTHIDTDALRWLQRRWKRLVSGRQWIAINTKTRWSCHSHRARQLGRRLCSAKPSWCVYTNIRIHRLD